MIVGAEELHALAAAAPALRPAVRRFYFIRHGETAGNAARIVQSPVIPLNERGRAQAAEAAERLAAGGADATHIEASSYPRAYETAQAVVRRLALPMRATPRLGERLFGELVGQSALELDWRARPAGGETLPEFVARTKAAAAAALGRGAPCLVAHGGNLRVLMSALGVAFSEDHAANALPLRFDLRETGWEVTIL